MSDKKLTVFQKLSKIFGPEGIKVPQEKTNRYRIGKDEILKTTSKTEFETAKKQAQQNRYISQLWQRVDGEMYQQSIHYEVTRIGSYMDFESMEFFPEIAAALDIFSEETCLESSTKIMLADTVVYTIEELYEKNITDFWVYAVDIKENILKSAKIDKVIYKGEKDVYKLTLDDDSEILCTDNHKWLTIDNSWVETKDLTLDTAIKTVFWDSNHKGSIKYRLSSTITSRSVSKIEFVGKRKVYDLLNSSVDENFAVNCNTGMIISHNCTPNDKGKILNIYSESKRVKEILEDLFLNRLEIHVNLPAWSRNLCKFGDNFLFLNIDDKAGIIGCRQMPNFEMERREGDLYNMLLSRSRTVNNDGNPKTEYDNKIKFFWKTKDVEFNSWQIAHFRLFGDDRKLCYGTSILEKARRVWKMLLMAEDAMLVYRVSRAAERRVFKIFVGNIDDADVGAYVNEIANRFKRLPVFDPATGQVDLRYNQMPVWRKTPIPLLDGRTISIEELAKESDEGKENWVYSIQDQTHQIVPGKVKWCGKNFTADEMIKVWLDDDSYIITEKSHPFILRDGTKKRGDELKENDSLMPFYRKIEPKNENVRLRYERIYNPNTDKYEFTHRLIAAEIPKNDESYNTVHHINFNKYDNSVPNLVWVDFFEHKKMHSELSKKNWADLEYKKRVGAKISEVLSLSYAKGLQNIEQAKTENWAVRLLKYNHSDLHKEHDEIRRQAQLNDWSDAKKHDLRRQGMQVKFDDIIWNGIKENILSGKILSRKTLLEYINTELIDHLIYINDNKRLNRLKAISRQVLESRLNENGYTTITEFIAKQKSNSKLNHKVKYIETVEGDDVYCMTVVGINGEEDRHNFAVLSFKNDGEINVSGSFIGNSNDQDIFVPTRDENAPSPIETLPGACISLNTRIPLVIGKTLTLSEIITEWDNGNRNLWVYSCNPETGEIVPSPITWAGITRKDTEVLKITLDNGNEIISTPDHKFVHRTKGFIEAKDLIVDDSLMPYNVDKVKITKIEWLTEKIDTGTITVDGDEKYHNYHTFATEAGIFIKNSNLSDIADIQYLQKKLCTALRVPKTFLGFEEAVGEGKNLALMDIRFSRTINRIQQSLLMELNKIAIIHLYVLGFEDELDNFVLTLNNPSTQAEMLKIEHLQQKVTLYKDAVSDAGNGFGAMSMTKGKKEILGFSDDEIKQDLLEQRIEKAAAAELANTAALIKKTGFFDKVDNIYGDPKMMAKLAAGEDIGGEEGADKESAPGGGGGFGGDGFGGAEEGEGGKEEENPTEGEGENLDFGTEGEAGGEAPPEGGENKNESPTENPKESLERVEKILNEQKALLGKKLEDRAKKYQGIYYDKLVNLKNPENSLLKDYTTKMTDKSIKINDKMNEMIDGIDNILKND